MMYRRIKTQKGLAPGPGCLKGQFTLKGRLPLRGQKGMVLLEVMIAFTVLCVALLPLLHCFTVISRINAATIRWGTALSLVESVLEEVLERPFEAIADGPERDYQPAAGAPAAAGLRYSVTVTEPNPWLKTIEVKVIYHDAAEQSWEISLTAAKAKR